MLLLVCVLLNISVKSLFPCIASAPNQNLLQRRSPSLYSCLITSNTSATWDLGEHTYTYWKKMSRYLISYKNIFLASLCCQVFARKLIAESSQFPIDSSQIFVQWDSRSSFILSTQRMKNGNFWYLIHYAKNGSVRDTSYTM